MKRNIILLSLLFLLSLACSILGKPSPTSTPHPTRTHYPTPTPTIQQKIIGVWEGYDPGSGTITFEFLNNATAKLSAGSLSVETTYHWIDEDTIDLTMDLGADSPVTQAMDVRIEGEKLYLTSNGQTVEFTSVK